MAVLTLMDLTNESFEQEVIQAPGPVLVEFWAPWCGYCRRLAPAVERISEQYEGKVQTKKANVDELPAIAEAYEVDTIPTLILFRDGKAGEPLINPESTAAIKDWLEQNGVI